MARHRWNMVSAMVCLGMFLSCETCSRGRKQMIEPATFASPDKPLASPSGRYELVVLPAPEGRIPYQTFEIRESGNSVFAANERFDNRHRTYFLWDDQDRVWVRSSDVGTYYWERQPDLTWKRFVHALTDTPAPPALRDLVRPGSGARQ